MENKEDLNEIELEEIPYLIYMCFVEEDKKTFKVYKNGKLLDDIQSIYIHHYDGECEIDLERQIGF